MHKPVDQRDIRTWTKTHPNLGKPCQFNPPGICNDQPAAVTYGLFDLASDNGMGFSCVGTNYKNNLGMRNLFMEFVIAPNQMK